MTTSTQEKTCPKCRSPIPQDAPGGLCPRCVMAGVSSTTPKVEAGVADVPSIQQIAPLFPQLEILELLGRGGMGFVYKARQLHLDREVALKLLPATVSSDAHFAERFTREARVLAKLNHPNIVMVHDFGSAGGFHYLIMEYVEGLNLRQAMRMGKFSPAEALAIVPKICDALQFAHEQGVLHRDIKPENLLLDTRGRIKIADFGIAKLVGEQTGAATLTGTGASLGTPHYMAPEQFENPAEVDHRADIYSLGVVFYEMLTGELPLGRFSAPSERTDIDERVDAIVLRALARERELRQKDARELRTEVEAFAATRKDSPALPTIPSGSFVRRFWVTHRRKLALGGAVLVFFLMAALIFLQKADYRRLQADYYSLNNRFARENPETVAAAVAALDPSTGLPVATNFFTEEDSAKELGSAEEIAQARQHYERMKARHSKGTVTDRELDLAHRDLLIAEARGDRRKETRAHYDFALKEFHRVRELEIDPREIWAREIELNKRQLEAELAGAGTDDLSRARVHMKYTERALAAAERLKNVRVDDRPAISQEDLKNFENEYRYAQQRYEQLMLSTPPENVFQNHEVK